MPSITVRHAEIARATPLAQRVTVRFAEASILTGLSINRLQQLVYSGQVKSHVVGRARLINVASLIALVTGEQPRQRRRRRQGR